jgi:hypothetical protein
VCWHAAASHHAEAYWRQLHILAGGHFLASALLPAPAVATEPDDASLRLQVMRHSVKTCTVIGNNRAPGSSYRKLHAATKLVITLESCCKRPANLGPCPAAAWSHTHPSCRTHIQKMLNSSTALNALNLTIHCQTTCANTAITTVSFMKL